MKARAWVLKAPSVLELTEFEVVEPAADQVLIGMRATSGCASDPPKVAGRSPFSHYPGIPGHEPAGQVEAIGLSGGLKKSINFDALAAKGGDHLLGSCPGPATTGTP